MTLAADLKNALIQKATLRPKAETATVNGVGIDLRDSQFNPFTAFLTVGAVSGTSPTLNVKIQESDDDSTYSDITGATFAQVTAANAEEAILVKNRSKRYVRAVATIAGTTPSFAVCCVVEAQKKIVGGSGVAT